MFQLHPQLEADSLLLGAFPLCQVRLVLDANYPWAILVPCKPKIQEMHELTPDDQQVLMSEISMLSKVLQDHFGAFKINVAALGNMVPQLHVHVVARFKSDPAWPGAIWGVAPRLPYSENESSSLATAMKEKLGFTP